LPLEKEIGKDPDEQAAEHVGKERAKGESGAKSRVGEAAEAVPGHRAQTTADADQQDSQE